MKVDLAESREDFVATRERAAGAPAARVRDLLQRFPAVSQGALSLVDQCIVSGTSFATAMIIGRTTSQETMGLYYLVASIIIVAVGVQEHVIAAPYMIYSKRRTGAALASFNGSVWFHHLLLTAFGMAALVVAIGLLSIGGTSALAPQLWILLGAGPLMLLREWIRRFAFSNLEIVPALAVDSVVSALQLIGLLLLAGNGSLSVFGIFAVMGVSCSLASLGWWLFARPEIRFQREQFMPDWRSNWSFGKWTTRSYLVGNTTQYVMPWILNLAVSTAAAGVLVPASR